MQVSDKTNVSNGLNGYATGALAGGVIGTAAVLKPIAKDSFDKSISKQQEAIEKFKESDKTVSEYMEGQRKKIDIVGNIDSTHKTYSGVKNTGKEQGFKEFYTDVVEKGTKTARKELDNTEKLLNKGKPSKFTAAKDSVKNTAGKVKDKFGSLKNSLKENLNGAEGLKGKFKAAKDSVVKFVRETPSLKKAGKFTLAGAVIGLGAAVIGKAVSKKASDK